MMKTMRKWVNTTRRKTMVLPGGVVDDCVLKMNMMMRWRKCNQADRVLGS